MVLQLKLGTHRPILEGPHRGDHRGLRETDEGKR